MNNSRRWVDINHPYIVAEELMDIYGRDVVFEFGKYAYSVDTIEDDRETLRVSGGEMTREFVESLIGSLRPGYELALHSTVRDKIGNALHIPMIDFCGRHHAEAWDRIKDRLPGEIVNSMVLFDSGSSYHAYSVTLISPTDWRIFMGNLLLLNATHGSQFVDTRWIGHRLMGGYGALRWSCNTSEYRRIPTRIALNEFFSTR